MATFFDLPPIDVIFKHIFDKLETVDIWKLRLTCRKFHELCWDYFSNTCKSLKISLSAPDGELGRKDCSFLEIGAGIKIMHISKYLQTLEIIGHGQLDVRGFVKLLELLFTSRVELKRLKLTHLDLTYSVAFLDGISRKCSNLLELELSKTVIKDRPIQQFLSQVLQHSGNNLRKLTLNSLTFTPNKPLPTKSLAGLRHFSVSLFTIIMLYNDSTCTFLISICRLLIVTI